MKIERSKFISLQKRKKSRDGICEGDRKIEQNVTGAGGPVDKLELGRVRAASAMGSYKGSKSDCGLWQMG